MIHQAKVKGPAGNVTSRYHQWAAECFGSSVWKLIGKCGNRVEAAAITKIRLTTRMHTKTHPSVKSGPVRCLKQHWSSSTKR